jgi:hypothetical protein
MRVCTVLFLRQERYLLAMVNRVVVGVAVAALFNLSQRGNS